MVVLRFVLCLFVIKDVFFVIILLYFLKEWDRIGEKGGLLVNFLRYFYKVDLWNYCFLFVLVIFLV